MSGNLTWALAYALAGVRVLPLHTSSDGRCSCHTACPKPGKHPRTEHGLTDASTDPDTIGRWWRQWPEANIGGVVPDGYAILDADTRDVELLPTLRASTGRGSHNWYTVSNGTKALGRPGVDVRHAGANYVVLPPSLHPSGVRYAWEGTFDLAAAVPLPAEWTQAARVSEPGERFALPDVIADGSRNTTLTSYGGALRRDVKDDAIIRAALVDANRTRCQPPLPADELDTIIRSVLRYEPVRPVVLDLADEPEAWTRLPPLERVPPPPKLLDPYVCNSRSILFGAQDAGKSALVAAGVAALHTGDAGYLPGCKVDKVVRVGILDYEDNLDEWAERLHRLGLNPGEVPYLDGRRPLTKAAGLARAADWIKDEGLELVAIDSVVPAAGIADAMKPEGPTAFFDALKKLRLAKWLLAHVPKDQALAKHPFGSTYWSTPSRLNYRVERIEHPKDHLIRVVNTKHSRWPETAPLVLRFDWGGDGLRVQPTGVVLDDTAYPLIDRIVAAIQAAGQALTADELAECVGSTADAVRTQARRHPHRVVSDDGRPHRYRVR